MESKSSKKRKLSVSSTATTVSQLSDDEQPSKDMFQHAVERPISPPPRTRRNRSAVGLSSPFTAVGTVQIRPDNSAATAVGPHEDGGEQPENTIDDRFHEQAIQPEARAADTQTAPRKCPSPVQLTKVDGFPTSSNLDTVSLNDILGDPLIKECWAFNYLFDVEWMMTHFDEDVREQVQVNLIHGFWKRGDPSKTYFDEIIHKFPNAKSIPAYMPEMYGTHHTKMFILFKHDDTAQVVILTANMLARDWRMAQAVWRSPALPHRSTPKENVPLGGFGTGSRFKHDLMAYLRVYESRLRRLTEQLEAYDFSTVKGALIASAPGRQQVLAGPEATLFGWPGARRILKSIPMNSEHPHIVAQVSSIGTLGVQDSWLRGTLLASLSSSAASTSTSCDYSIVFPTAEEIRRTHDGYSCGGSIHFKTQKPQNQKQLKYMRPMLCHWAGDCSETPGCSQDEPVRVAGRKRAGPHIKTYIRFSDKSVTNIDWAMVTSANLSKQAWGEAKSYDDNVRVSSYELGVIIWPQLYTEGTEEVKMVPTFKSDTPSEAEDTTVVGFRMPYDLPLVPYSKDTDPWCCSAADDVPDWQGRTWQGYGN